MRRIAKETKFMAMAGVLSLALLAIGCGEQKREAAVETQATQAAAVEQTTPAVTAATSVATPEAESTTETGAANTPESLPPDVTAFAPDSLVIPGSVIEITAQASTDATSLILMDRLGHPYPFVYDTEAKGWRVYYRVPLETKIDRLGLSVTATNGTDRWKRVWVFLKIQGGVPEESDGC